MNADKVLAGLRCHSQRMASRAAAARRYSSAFICVHLWLHSSGFANGASPRGQSQQDASRPPVEFRRGTLRRSVGRWLAPSLLAALAACTAPTPEGRLDAATRAACRARADQQYEIRHRDTIYAVPQDSNTPFSGAYAPGVPSRGLSQLYEHEMIMRDCVRNAGPESDREPVAPTDAPPRP